MAQHDDAPLAEVLAEMVADADTKAVFRRLLQQALNELIESEVTAAIGAAPHERTDTRTNQRNGGRGKTLSTPAGHVEVLGCDVGDSEDEVSWTQFLRSLRQRGLSGVRLVISDAHEGLKAAVGRVLAGAGWQRCRVHFVRNALAKVSKSHAEMVAATVRTIFAQPDAPAAREQLHAVVDMLRAKFPAVADQLADAEADLLAYAAFPRAHWRRIWSTNPLERVNKEIKRRSNVVGIFPNDAAVIRLVGAVLLETHDEWQVAERAYFSDASMADLPKISHDTDTKEVTSDPQHALPAA